MKNFINWVCFPLVLFGAINYGLIGLFGVDLISYLHDLTVIRIVYVLIGAAGVGLATGWFGKK